MMRNTGFFHVFILLLLNISLNGQETAINYRSFQNGIENEAGAYAIETGSELAYLSADDSRIKTFIDYQKALVVKIIEYNNKLYRMDTPFDSLPSGKISGEKATILGYDCKQMVYDYFSNKVEVYYTEESGKRGSPFSNFIPSPEALVLKVVINGNRELLASKIESIDRDGERAYPYEQATAISAAEFEELRIKTRYVSLPVFTGQIINFDPEIPKPDWNVTHEKVFRLANGTIVLKKIQLPEIVKKGGYTYVNLKCRSNGDAYDRTGSVFTISPGEDMSMLDALMDSIQLVPYITDKKGERYHGYRLEKDFSPALELMRFFTSFGADHFNDKRVIHNFPWEKTATYKQEVTRLIPTHTNEIWVGVFIGNYSKGGHIIDLDLEFYPSFDDQETVSRWIQPLFNTVNIMEMAGQEYPRLFKTDTLEVEFEIPDSTTNINLYYTSTGHGGWGGGDEFNPRLNEIFLDGELLFKIAPWRTDCAKFRLYNPASGNFENGLSSSDFSRSNWCPACSTPPYIVPMTNLKPGKHRMKIMIQQGNDEGGSFNAWAISGVLSGE
jgi:hypothetical protein